MQLGWIDYSKNERNKITSILRLLGTQTSLDELGIGTVRDGFSDLLFPGISTLQTRAKYFLLIPYLFADAEKHKFNRFSEVRTWISKQEERLIKTLVENSDQDAEGIIGSRTYKQGKTLKIKPTSIYWNGLRKTGILRQPEFSIDNACEIAFVHSQKRNEISLKAEGDNEFGDDRDALNDGVVLFSPILPDYDYMTESTITLTQSEATYLLEHFVQSEGTEKSLMAYMLSHHLLFDDFSCVDTDMLPEGLKYIVSMAQDFSTFIYGAHLLYNVIYSEGSDVEMIEAFSEWKDKEYGEVDLDAIITVSGCPKHTGDFLHRFYYCINSNDIKAAKQAVIDREKYIKRDRAKLCKPDQYRYENPVHYYKLDYRYRTAATIIADIYEGLGTMARQMFNQDTNRLDYSELLLPEVGYNLDFAVGLTYSLDLEALLGVPVSLGLFDGMDSSHMQNPYFLLEAIRKSSDKIAIFCNAGSIKLPQRIEPVYALLENSVFEVSLDKNANFHPKLWVIKYSNEDDISYIKLITLSRNLTFDRSFDVAAEMTGIIGDTVAESHRPLSDLLRFVAGYSTDEKSKQIKALAREVLKVPEFELAEPFESYVFHPFGIPGHKGTAEKLLIDSNNLLVISPFLSDGVVEKLTAQPTNKTLITRKSSVSPKILHCFDDIFITKDVVMDNELLEESDNTDEAKRDIHAKVYFKKNYSGNYLYLGSLNASANAFYHNVEFLLELKFKPNYTSYQAILNDFLPEERNPFEPLLSSDEYQSENTGDEMDGLSDVVDALQSANATLCNNRYSVTVQCSTLAYPAEIAPLYRPRSFVSLGEVTQLPELLLKELSEFYIIRRGNKYAVMKIQTDGIPYEERDNAIYSAVIGSKSGFLAFVTFMLADNFSEASMEQQHYMDALQRGEAETDIIPAALYERLLRTAVANPKKLEDIENVMQRLEPEIVTNDFRSLLATFQNAVKKVKRK